MSVEIAPGASNKVGDGIVAIEGFNFLRKNRTTTQRAEQLGIYLAELTGFHAMNKYPEIIRKYLLTKEGRYLSDEEAKAYKPKYTSQALTNDSMIVVEPVRLDAEGIIAVRRKSNYSIAQLVVPEMLTYVGSVANTEEVLACADEGGNLFGPYGGEFLPISAEFVDNLDAVLTEYSSRLGLPEPGKI